MNQNKENKNDFALEYVQEKFKKYYGGTQREIYEHVFKKPLKTIPKDLNHRISRNLLDINKLKENNYIVKNIPVNKMGNAKERMTFRRLKLSEFDTEWNDSYWKKYFERNTFIVICYKGNSKEKNGERRLDKIKKIKINDDELKLMKKTYDLIKKTIKTEDLSYLPKPRTFENQILEIAPKRRIGKNSYETFLDNELTNICFALTKNFLNEKIKKEINSSSFY